MNLFCNLSNSSVVHKSLFRAFRPTGNRMLLMWHATASMKQLMINCTCVDVSLLSAYICLLMKSINDKNETELISDCNRMDGGWQTDLERVRNLRIRVYFNYRFVKRRQHMKMRLFLAEIFRETSKMCFSNGAEIFGDFRNSTPIALLIGS